MKISASAIASILPLTAAFAPQANNNAASSKNTLQAEPTVSAVAVPSANNPIFDPLGLYPVDLPERQDGLVRPMENYVDIYATKDVVDPLGLYRDQSQVTKGVKMSPALPFLARPALLDGTMAGDRGFDPFNFAADANALQWQRKAELKHARLAMLGAAGWLGAELLHKDIASAFNLPALLASGDRVPSVLNDGLVHAPFPAFWIATIAAAAAFEIRDSVEEYSGKGFNPAEMRGFDPLNLGGKTAQEKRAMQESEITNGRISMLAITGFAIQEFFLNDAVVHQIPSYLKPIEQLLN